MRSIFLLLILFFSLSGFSQSILTDKKVNLSFSGFVRNDFIFDSRRNIEAVDGLFPIWPEKPSYDANGDDINAKASARILSVSTRIGTRLTGLEIGNAKIGSFVEIDFTGGQATNSIRLRHAYTTVNWERTQLIFGRTWHPLFIEKVYPSVLNLNTGVPFQVFNRSPQLRMTHKMGNNWNIIAAAVYQTKYVSLGPDGKSSRYQRDAIVPDLHGQIQYFNENWVAGAAFDWKMIQPRAATTGSNGNTYIANEKLASSAILGYLKYTRGKFQFKVKTMLGQNLAESVLPGGYAVATKNNATGAETYTPTNHSVSFVNFTYGAKWRVGLFAGYFKNLGTRENPIGPFYARGADVDYSCKIAPQLVYSFRNFLLGWEPEIMTIGYGTIDYLDKGRVKDVEGVTNFRNLITLFYFF